MLPLNKNIKIILNYVVGPLVFCVLAWSIYKQLVQQPNWWQSLKQVQHALYSKDSWWKIGLTVLLMFLNWGLEARKWQVAIARIQRISFAQCVRAIFTGTTMGFFTPNRMGEYMGRILYIEEGKRIKAISLTIVCSMSQLMVTLWTGLAGIVYLKHEIAVRSTAGSASVLFWINTVMYITLAVVLVLTLFYFRLSWLVRWVEKIPRIEKFLEPVRVLDSFNATILSNILSLSLIRYFVFIAQYYLLFSAFNVELTGIEAFGCVSVVFLVLAVVPTIGMITELGIRWKTSMELVQFFSSNSIGILATSLAIWVINLVIPALLGSLLILGVRIFRNK
ncbi:MAG: lysylphosphatidylglycerol synthase domain-containing protein [Chitinophagaceae bacterium]